jgi:haloacetate dehalogenase
MLEGFTHHKVKTTGAEINFRSAGHGRRLLLRHRYPQAPAMWPKIAPDRARRLAVVAADLRGCGDSSKPPSESGQTLYSKRAMPADMVELMAPLGSPLGARGGRVADRLALDPQAPVETHKAMEEFL